MLRPILCLSRTRSSDTEISHVTLYYGPVATPDLSPEPRRASRSRFRFGRDSSPRRPHADPHAGRGHLEKHHLPPLVDDLGVSLGVPGTPYLNAWANSGRSGGEQMASPRDPGRFPVFATCPVVISAHSQTIANQR